MSHWGQLMSVYYRALHCSCAMVDALVVITRRQTCSQSCPQQAPRTQNLQCYKVKVKVECCCRLNLDESDVSCLPLDVMWRAAFDQFVKSFSMFIPTCMGKEWIQSYRRCCRDGGPFLCLPSLSFSTHPTLCICLQSSPLCGGSYPKSR